MISQVFEDSVGVHQPLWFCPDVPDEHRPIVCYTRCCCLVSSKRRALHIWDSWHPLPLPQPVSQHIVNTICLITITGLALSGTEAHRNNR